MKNKVKFEVEDEINELPDDQNKDESKLDTQENIETINSDDMEQFFVTENKYNELREAMEDTDFRLFLINDDLVIPGAMNGNEIQFLDFDGDEFVLRDAPITLDELLKFNTLYNTENSELINKEDNISEAPHENIIEYILSLKVNDEDTEDVKDVSDDINSSEEESDNENNE